jgi:hypothetical protein
MHNEYRRQNSVKVGDRTQVHRDRTLRCALANVRCAIADSPGPYGGGRGQLYIAE